MDNKNVFNELIDKVETYDSSTKYYLYLTQNDYDQYKQYIPEEYVNKVKIIPDKFISKLDGVDSILDHHVFMCRSENIEDGEEF